MKDIILAIMWTSVFWSLIGLGIEAYIFKTIHKKYFDCKLKRFED